MPETTMTPDAVAPPPEAVAPRAVALPLEAERLLSAYLDTRRIGKRASTYLNFARSARRAGLTAAQARCLWEDPDVRPMMIGVLRSRFAPDLPQLAVPECDERSRLRSLDAFTALLLLDAEMIRRTPGRREPEGR